MALLAMAPAAHADTTVNVAASAFGIQAGGVVQIPITAGVPIQACNNNVTAGLIAVAVEVLSGGTCAG